MFIYIHIYIHTHQELHIYIYVYAYVYTHGKGLGGILAVRDRHRLLRWLGGQARKVASIALNQALDSGGSSVTP